MKKLLPFFLLLVSSYGKSQITFTQADLPLAGSSYLMAADYGYSGTVPAGGAMQNWDFSNLLNNQTDTFGFQAAAGTPYASNFANANLASHSVADSAWIYFQSNANGLYVDGTYLYGTAGGMFGGLNGAIDLNPNLCYAPTPFTYTNTRLETGRIVVDIDTALPYIRIILRIDQTFTADGYGSLILPNSTYPNTLRIKETQLTSDTFLIDVLGLGFYVPVSNSQEQSTYYRWYRNGQPSYLLGLSADSLGQQADQSEFLLGGSTVGLNEPLSTLNPGSQLYPNPAKDYVQLKIANPGEDLRFRLSDMSGRVVREKDISGMNAYGFYVNQLPAGMYVWTIEGSGRLEQGKVVIQ